MSAGSLVTRLRYKGLQSWPVPSEILMPKRNEDKFQKEEKVDLCKSVSRRTAEDFL